MTRLDFFRAAAERIKITQGTTLDPNSVSIDGTAVNIIVSAAAAIGDELDARNAARQAANLSQTARDTDLDVLITEETFGRLTRKSASASQVALYATRPAPATGDVVINAGEIIVIGALQFTIDSQAIFPSGVITPRSITATCTKVGSNTNIAVASPVWKSPANLGDPSITLSPVTSDNGSFATGGSDREKNSDFRARRASYGQGLDRNLDFLVSGALGVNGILFAAAIEVIDANDIPTGAVQLYIGDINGRANDATIAKVRAALRGFRMAGQHVEIIGSVPSLQTIVLSFGVLDGFVQADVLSAAKAAVIVAVNALAPGATLSRATIAAAITSVPGSVLLSAVPFGCTIPAADVVATSAVTIFRTSDALVSFA